jgi:hypothetical protein
MKNLTNSELIEVNGGHDGPAYKAGKAVGEFLHDVVDVAEVYLTFLG